jgi:hypothetical protein
LVAGVRGLAPGRRKVCSKGIKWELVLYFLGRLFPLSPVVGLPKPAQPGAAVAPGGRLLALASLGLGCTACRFNRGRNPLVPFAFLVKMCHTET